MKYFYRILKRLIFKLLPQDSQVSLSGMKIGVGSRVIDPSQIDGREFITIGNHTTIKGGAWISAYDHYAGMTYTPSIIIQDDVYIGGRACITAINGIKIGSGCVISEDVYISDHIHGHNPEKGLISKQELISKGKVEIGDNTFIGFRVSILPGVILGKNCVVGAHSVVTRPFPAFTMLAGIPAKIIKTYSFEKHEWLDLDEIGS